jgi:hypothetical protein
VFAGSACLVGVVVAGYAHGMVDLVSLARAGAAVDDDGPPPPPTPDELLLELMDLVTLAFPEVLDEMVVTFVPNEDGKRPALTNLDGRARPAPGTRPIKRPELGHEDGAVLDAINALLRDFADGTLAQGGVRVLRGRIEIRAAGDGARDVMLIDEDQGERVVMTRRFDASELRWLLFSPALFVALERTAAEEQAQKARVDEALAGMRRFDIDMKKGTITFSAPDRAASPWSFELIGSFVDEQKRFLWGWANDQVDPKLTRSIDALRQRSTGPGLRALTDGSFGGPEELFVRLARHVAVETGAFGVYRAPFASAQGKGFMYLALRAS